MVDHVGEGVKVKAAGGISSFADGERFIEIGADRLGTSRLVKIIKNSSENRAGLLKRKKQNVVNCGMCKFMIDYSLQSEKVSIRLAANFQASRSWQNRWMFQG